MTRPCGDTSVMPAYVLVVHGRLNVLRRLLMVLRELVGLLLVVGKRVDPHEAVVAAPLGVSHGGGGEVGRRQHDGGLHALLPHLTAAALLWKGEEGPTCETPTEQ